MNDPPCTFPKEGNLNLADIQANQSPRVNRSAALEYLIRVLAASPSILEPFSSGEELAKELTSAADTIIEYMIQPADQQT